MAQSLDRAGYFLSRVETRNAAECGACFEETGQMFTPFSPLGLPRVSIGRAQCVNTFSVVFSMLEKFIWKDVVLLAGENKNVVFGTGRSEAILKGGDAYQNEYCFLFEFVDGLIHVYREYFDPQPILAKFADML